MPLPVIADSPLFTLLLPKSAVYLALDEIKSYKLKAIRSRKNMKRRFITLNMKNGDVITTELNIRDNKKFRETLNAAFEGRKVVAEIEDDMQEIDD